MRCGIQRWVRSALVASALLMVPARLLAQGPPSCPSGICIVSSEAQLRDALTPGGAVDARNGDTIIFTGNITLTSDMTPVNQSITIDGNGFSLSGAGTFRGLSIGAFSIATPLPITVTVQNLTIQ